MDAVTTAPFPVEYLNGYEDGLVLFAAAFGGVQDARFLVDAGMRGTCVDIDGEKLAEMRPEYPEDWEFVHAEAFEFASRAERTWDVVTLDCPTSLFTACALGIDRWCSLARHLVVLGCAEKTLVRPPDPWREVERRKRSGFQGGVYWAVIES